jgi:hypothetical protein
MKNYTESDFAINKFSKGIVYLFTNEIVEITLEKYLVENPEKEKTDFLILKALSNEIYLEQVRDKNAQTKEITSLSLIEETNVCSTKSLEDEYFASLDKKEEPTFTDTIIVLNGCLTKTQKRRYLLYHYQNKTMDEIANLEHVNKSSVFDTLSAAKKRIKKYLFNFHKTTSQST